MWPVLGGRRQRQARLIGVLCGYLYVTCTSPVLLTSQKVLANITGGYLLECIFLKTVLVLELAGRLARVLLLFRRHKLGLVLLLFALAEITQVVVQVQSVVVVSLIIWTLDSEQSDKFATNSEHCTHSRGSSGYTAHFRLVAATKDAVVVLAGQTAHHNARELKSNQCHSTSDDANSANSALSPFPIRLT